MEKCSNTETCGLMDTGPSQYFHSFNVEALALFVQINITGVLTVSALNQCIMEQCVFSFFKCAIELLSSISAYVFYIYMYAFSRHLPQERYKW